MMSSNPETLVSVHCYAGDADRVRLLLPQYEHHRAPVVILSPSNAPVANMGPHICRMGGKRAYIGQDSLDRQIEHFRILLQYDFQYFLLNDSDSFCVAAKIPARLFEDSESTVWSNEISDPRPHESPYPKLAFQPPYFVTRDTLMRLLEVAPRIRAHSITPYIDWAMCAWTCEAGLKHRAFTELEHSSKSPTPFAGTDPWAALDYRIRYHGTVMMHPIKTAEQVQLCVRARKFYEQQ